MKITVKAKPRARKNEVLKLPDGTFQVSVSSPPVDDKANEKIIELLAEYFHTPKRGITIVSGNTSKIKIIEIL